MNTANMKTIDRKELKAKLDRGDNFKLVMTMDDYAYDHMHIPGSLHFNNMVEALKQLKPDDEVVLYCSTKWCHDSINAYLILQDNGFDKIYRYPGGLEDWEKAHYPLEGDMVQV